MAAACNSGSIPTAESMMSGTRIDPAPPAIPSPSTDSAPRPAPSGPELADALAGLAGDLLRVDLATRLARAQAQVVALLSAALLAAVRGDHPAMRGLAAEAGRIGRDLATGGLDSDQVAAIVAQARQVGQVHADCGAAPLPTDIVT